MTTSAPAVRPDRRTAPSFYDRLYAQAEGDPGRIPWSDGRAHPALVRWLDVVAPQLVRCGGRVVVPACGFGADATEVARRGYEVLGFDAAPAALHWARRLDPDGSVAWVEADLFDLPARWRHRFDLVVEVNTVQALAPECRGDVLAAMADLVAPHGHLLAIGRAVPPESSDASATPDAAPIASASAAASASASRDEGDEGDEGERRDGPPWPVDVDELVGLAAAVGLEPEHDVHRFESDERPGRWLFRGLFRRPS